MISAYLFPCPDGLALAEMLLAKRTADGQFTIDGQEVRTLLAAAYACNVSPRAMRHIQRACELLKDVTATELEYASVPLRDRPAHALPGVNRKSL